ncbi:MAG: FtsX-like permease family protein [Terrimicrobiaceae bacterium]|nr:FtsX-like permease family protein [Terrimicrobiaceae bacterium]
MLFARQCGRTLARHPLLLPLNVLSIGLGIAVFLAIQIANRSATESFRAGIDLVAGRANLEVRGVLDESLLPRIAAIEGVRSATPLVEGVVTIPDHPGEYLRIVGLDPFSGGELRTFELLGADRARLDLETWLRDPEAIAVSRDYSERVLPALGDPIRVLAASGPHALHPRFVMEPAIAAAGDPRIAAMDIGWAQELLQKRGRLTAILLLVTPGQLDAVRARIRELVPADVEVAPPSRRGSQIEAMLGAFQLNLTALSLVSVLVGAFLIYNTVSASVVRRQREIGILRALGATRHEVRLLFLGEAAVSGLIGTALGAAVALPLASALSAPIAQTVRTLYILTSIDRLVVSPWQFAEALAIGLGAALLAAWVPANEAARAEPARVLHPGAAIERFGAVPRRWLLAGIALLAAAAILGWATLRFRLPPLGFASALGVLAGFSLVAPAAIRTACRAMNRSPRYLRLAARNLSRSVHRSAVTVAALAAAIAMTVSVSVMIHSFRASVNEWIDATLVDDLYIGLAANESGPLQAALPAEAVRWLAAQPGVEHVATRAETTIDFRGEPAELSVATGARTNTMRFLGGGSEGQFRDFLAAGTVGVSEPFASRFRVARGDRIALRTPRGPVEFRVAGVFQDYARSGGVIVMKREDYERHWEPIGAQSVALALAPAVDPAAIGDAFRARFGAGGQYAIRSNRALRDRIFDIFDQTFAVTLVLRAISVVVAAAGVTLALLILAAEREREIGVLRAIGASRGQVVGLFLREAGLIGLLASALGVASGCCLAMVLTWVVNKAFFGWTIQLSYPAGVLLSTPLWIVPVAVVAAILPAWRAACVPPAAAVRFE